MVPQRLGEDPTQRFGARACAYARARPGYPDDVVTKLVQLFALAPGGVIVDLGCGTGLSSEAFLRAGYRVLGVEPNEAMREHAARLAAQYPNFAVAAGRAEATGLKSASADLLIAAQAFHWFDVEATRKEALRILRAPPRAALLWNDRRTEGSEFARGYEALLQRFCTEYLEVQHRHARAERITQFFGNDRWSTVSLPHSDALSFETLADRLNSASYAPPAGEPRHLAMMQQLRELFAATAHEGLVPMEFDTRIHYGVMESRPAPGPAPTGAG